MDDFETVWRFSETTHVDHVGARAKIMANRFDFPDAYIFPCQDLFSTTTSFVSGLNNHGVALFRGGSSLSDEEFIGVGERLGKLMPEHDASAQSFTSQGVILSVISRSGHDASVYDQPFSTHHLRLHSECSLRAAASQPRYLVFLCVSPGSTETRAQTLIVSMARVAARLTDEEKYSLSRICYANSSDRLPLLRQSGGGPIFSFRDFGPDVLEWKAVSEDDPVDETAGNAAIQALLVAMYDNTDTFGVTWRANDLLILDNMRVFHGRSDASPQPIGDFRQIKRLRVLADGPY